MPWLEASATQTRRFLQMSSGPDQNAGANDRRDARANDVNIKTMRVHVHVITTSSLRHSILGWNDSRRCCTLLL